MQVAITCNHLCIVELLQEEGASMNRYCTVRVSMLQYFSDYFTSVSEW